MMKTINYRKESFDDVSLLALVTTTFRHRFDGRSQVIKVPVT